MGQTFGLEFRKWNSDKNWTRSPLFLLLVQPEGYNPEASCWGFGV